MSSTGRRTCDRCHRPPRVCVCASLPPSPALLPWPVASILVLQHPKEAKKAQISSVPLIPLCLQIAVGTKFAAGTSRALDDAVAAGRRSLLLFPSMHSRGIKEVVAEDSKRTAAACAGTHAEHGSEGGERDDVAGSEHGGEQGDAAGCSVGSTQRSDVGVGGHGVGPTQGSDVGVGLAAPPGGEPSVGADAGDGYILVLVDGTWNQARSMLNRSPYLTGGAVITEPDRSGAPGAGAKPGADGSQHAGDGGDASATEARGGTDDGAGTGAGAGAGAGAGVHTGVDSVAAASTGAACADGADAAGGGESSETASGGGTDHAGGGVGAPCRCAEPAHDTRASGGAPQPLRHVHLVSKRVGEYRWRKEPRDFSLSTLEAVACALEAVCDADQAREVTEPLVAAFRAMVRIQEEFSRAKAAARAERRAAAAARSQPGGGPTGAAPIVDDRSVRRWYGYYLSVVLPGRVEYKLEGEPFFGSAKAAVQEAKRRNVGRVRGQRYSALPLHKMTPEHPVLVSNAEDSDHPAVPSSHHE